MNVTLFEFSLDHFPAYDIKMDNILESLLAEIISFSSLNFTVCFSVTLNVCHVFIVNCDTSLQTSETAFFPAVIHRPGLLTCLQASLSRHMKLERQLPTLQSNSWKLRPQRFKKTERV